MACASWWRWLACHYHRELGSPRRLPALSFAHLHHRRILARTQRWKSHEVSNHAAPLVVLQVDLERCGRTTSYARQHCLLRLRPEGLMVPRRGLEPPRVLPHWHLKPARLPIPPPGHRSRRARNVLTAPRAVKPRRGRERTRAGSAKMYSMISRFLEPRGCS